MQKHQRLCRILTCRCKADDSGVQAGGIILVLLISFPLVLGGLTGANPGTGTPADAVANGLTYALQYLAMCVLLILALVKSGSWARDIVSGF